MPLSLRPFARPVAISLDLDSWPPFLVGRAVRAPALARHGESGARARLTFRSLDGSRPATPRRPPCCRPASGSPLAFGRARHGAARGQYSFAVTTTRPPACARAIHSNQEAAKGRESETSTPKKGQTDGEEAPIDPLDSHWTVYYHVENSPHQYRYENYPNDH